MLKQNNLENQITSCFQTTLFYIILACNFGLNLIKWALTRQCHLLSTKCHLYFPTRSIRILIRRSYLKKRNKTRIQIRLVFRSTLEEELPRAGKNQPTFSSYRFSNKKVKRCTLIYRYWFSLPSFI